MAAPWIPPDPYPEDPAGTEYVGYDPQLDDIDMDYDPTTDADGNPIFLTDRMGSVTDPLDRFNQVTEYADQLGQATTDILQEIRNSVSGDLVPTWEVLAEPDLSGIPGMSAGKPNFPIIDPIEIPPVDFSQPIPDFPTIVIPTDPPPDYNPIKPMPNIPPMPAITFPKFDDDPPQIGDPSIPSPPIYTLPPVPRIDDIVIPSPPDFNFPEWTEDPPTEDLTPPDPMFAWNETEYDSVLKSLVTSRLADEVVTGGRGIDEAWEAAFLTRRRNDLAEKHEQLYVEAENRWAGRGFTMPPGALAGQILEIQKQAMRDDENLQNDIIIKQEELAHEYGKFVLESSINWEKALMDYSNSFQNRAFEAAKYTVQVMVDIFQVRVEAYKAQLEAYKTMAIVYEARIRAETAKAEMYKAQIEGVKAQVDVKQALIEAYKAQITGISTLVDLYKAEMEGARIEAEVDRTRIQSFQALVEAYAANVNAIKSRYEAYQAQIEGEVSKVKIWEAEARAYEAEVKGYAAKAEVDVSRAEAELKVIQGKVEIYKGAIEKYGADITYAMKNVDAQLGIEKLDVEAWDIEMKGYIAELDAAIRRAMVDVERYKGGAGYAQAQATIVAAQARASATTGAAAAEAAARTGAATIAAAYSGISHTSSHGVRMIVSDVSHRGGTRNHQSQAQSARGHYTHVNK
jgi:hypothetical protein